MSGESDASREKGRIWVGSIVIDCTDFARMFEFWTQALHYVPRNPPKPDWVVLKDPKGQGPNISLNLTREGPLKDYRLHLDLYATDPLEEVERLIRLGATLVRSAEKGKDFVTLADPDGNPFDVIDINWPDEVTDWEFGRRA